MVVALGIVARLPMQRGKSWNVPLREEVERVRGNLWYLL